VELYEDCAPQSLAVFVWRVKFYEAEGERPVATHAAEHDGASVVALADRM